MNTEADVTVDGALIDYSGLPQRYRETVRLYVEHRIDPGTGWCHILCHDLQAVIYCDDEMVRDLPTILRWLHNRAPGLCHGSRQRVEEWLRGPNRHVAEPFRTVLGGIFPGAHRG